MKSPNHTNSLARRRILRVIADLEEMRHEGRHKLPRRETVFLDEMIKKRDRCNQDGRGIRYTEEEVFNLADLEWSYLK